jgi:hypothetical protein
LIPRLGAKLIMHKKSLIGTQDFLVEGVAVRAINSHGYRILHFGSNDAAC